MAAAVGLLLLLAVPLPSVAAQSVPSESEVEAAWRQDARRSGLPVLSTGFFYLVDFEGVGLVCPGAVVEGDVIRCFVAGYTLVGKRWLGLIRLWEQFRLPTPVVAASAGSLSVPQDVLAGRFESPGFATSSGGDWWVSVRTVDDDRCDPLPYSLDLKVTAGIFSLGARVMVLDDGDPRAPGESGVECVPPSRLEALDASGPEGDGALVFVVRATEAVPLADVRVDYALTAGSAAAGSDYGDVSGTLTIPAGTRHATISVPLVDDAVVEGDESFGLALSNPVGAILADAAATATVADDDAAAAPVPQSAAVCDDVVLAGSVRDVFDVAQPGFAGDHHAFVDVDVTCPGAGSPAGIPVAVSVVGGSQASLGASTHCLAQVGARTVTASAAAAAGCGTFAVPRPVGEAAGGRSTHLVKVPDGSVGQAHQLLVWADADRDRTHDRGEPYQYVASDFVRRSVGGATLVDYGLADDFDVELAAAGSDRIGRGGLESELRLRLHTTSRMARTHGEPVIATAPLANALVGVSVAAGPSTGADVMCLSTAGTASRCRTDADGQIIVRYRVGTSPVSVLRRSQDTLAVFHDPDQDGRRAFGAPTSFLTRPVAKAVNYVALGDSYTSGEQGRPDTPGFQGAYENDPDSPETRSADAYCRRWNLAYPYVFANDVLRGTDPNIDLQFQTFACTGATTLHIYDPADADGTGLDTDTNRPAPGVPQLLRRSQLPVGSPPVEHIPDGWEPRQAVSLAGVQDMSDVDMITVTIGGNDAGFADVLRGCVLGGRDCGRGVLPSDYGEIGGRVVTLLSELKRVAPNASIFLLGYPHITPEPTEANRRKIETCGLHGQPLQASSINSGAVPAIVHFLLGGNVADTSISYPEAAFLWEIAAELNDTLRTAAVDAGVHFVDVSRVRPSPSAMIGFAGHSPCSAVPWLNGFVAYTGSRRHLDMPVADDSFHPNEAGHRAYARLLESFIAAQVAAGTPLNESGLAANPRAAP